MIRHTLTLLTGAAGLALAAPASMVGRAPAPAPYTETIPNTTVTFQMVQKGFREQDIAYASAIAVIFFLIILVISLIQRRVLRTQEG